MSWKTFSRIAEYLHLTEEVDLTGGGEPLNNSRLPEMVRVVKEAGCQVGFSTNGFFLTPDLSETLVSLKLDWISFSVDGATSEVYNSIRQGSDFEVIKENIVTLRDIKTTRVNNTPKMMMVFVLMHQNYHQLPMFIDLAYKLGVEQIIAKNLDVIIKDGDDERRIFSNDGPPAPEVEAVFSMAQQRAGELGIKLRLYALQPKELSICEHNPVRSLFINWEGLVSPCITQSYAENRVFNGKRVQVPRQIFGNINQMTLDDIWNQPEYHRFRQTYEERLRLEKRTMIDSILGNLSEGSTDMSPAPEGCRSCYYLYGV